MREERENHRAHGRRVLEGLKCDLGRVLDMSRGGMRIACNKLLEQGEELETCLESLEDDVDVRVKVCWSRKVGFRKYQAGVQFLDVDDELGAKLLQISTVHQLSKVLKY